MKRCTKCKCEKPLDLFYRNKSKPDGRATECKECANSVVKDWQHKNPDKLVSWARRYYRNNAVKKCAHATANYAVKVGLILKKPCSVCAAPNADKHHEDYRKPLDVVWLCRKCHKAEHARMAAA